MPRRPRFNIPGYPLHVIQRGNNRQACFFRSADYWFYLECLSKACQKYSCRVHAYVLMTNHVHLLITPENEYGVSQVMQSVGRRYVRIINDLYNRTGTLWEGRYKACLVDENEYLLACYRYIELNPVRAGMVERPAEYRWSSYRHHAHGEKNGLISPHPVYLSLGPTQTRREQCYRELFSNRLEEKQLHEIRTALIQELALGSEKFKDDMQAMTKRRTRLLRAGRIPIIN